MTRKVATFSRPADNTIYSTGDAIANSTTGASVTPMTFTLDFPSGSILSCSCVVTPASGNLVITGLDFDLLLFRPNTSIPFAAGSFPADNAAMDITATAYRDLIGVFSFTSGNWRNPAGAYTAGATGFQAVPTQGRYVYEFEVGSCGSNTIIGVVQAKGSWAPTGVVNRFDFALEGSFE